MIKSVVEYFILFWHSMVMVGIGVPYLGGEINIKMLIEGRDFFAYCRQKITQKLLTSALHTKSLLIVFENRTRCFAQRLTFSLSFINFKSSRHILIPLKV